MDSDQHLFYPLLCLQDRDANGKKQLVDKDTNEPLITEGFPRPEDSALQDAEGRSRTYAS